MTKYKMAAVCFEKLYIFNVAVITYSVAEITFVVTEITF